MKYTICLLAFGLFSSAASQVHAEAREIRETAFTIEATAITNASPAEVYRALGTVSEWWDPEHTWSGASKNLSLQLQAGGCFCEQLADGGSIQHGRVIYAQPGVMVRLDTPLGPLQEMPVTGILTFNLAPQGAGTRITMTYRVAGGFTMESAKLAPIVDFVMGVQLGRLKSYGDALKPQK